MKKKTILNQPKILKEAIKIVDKQGLQALSMRKIASRLKVEAMSLYHYFNNKDDLLGAMIDHVFSEIKWTHTFNSKNWKSSIRNRCLQLREVLNRHPWSVGLLESHPNPGPETLKHHDEVLGCFLDAGFSESLSAHSYALIDSFVYGFALQENAMPVTEAQDIQDLAEEIINQIPENHYPYFTKMTKNYYTKPNYDFSKEFTFGLDLILDGLEQKRLKEMNQGE